MKTACFAERKSLSVGKHRIFHDVIVHFYSLRGKSDEARRYHDVKTMAKWPKGIGVTWSLFYSTLKGLGHDCWCLFTISFYPKFLNRTTIFKLIVHSIEQHAAFEERKIKQTNAKSWFKKLRVIFLFQQNWISNAILWEKKDNSILSNVYKHKWLLTMFTKKDLYGWFQLSLLFIFFQNGLYIFGGLSVRILLECHVK